MRPQYSIINDTHFVIEPGIKTIKSASFKHFNIITSVQIPDGVETIEAQAFEFCTKLKEIVIPEGVVTIEDSAFAHCSSMEKIVLPDTLMYIGTCAFSYCLKLKEIVLPPNLSFIGSWAFNRCSKLKTFKLPDSVISGNVLGCSVCSTLYNKNVLYRCSADISGKFVVPEGISIIADYAFSGCDLIEEIELPSTLLQIGEYAFENCVNLKKLNIPNGVRVIRGNFISGCISLSSLSIPGSVISIDCLGYNEIEEEIECNYFEKIKQPLCLEEIFFYNRSPQILGNFYEFDKFLTDQCRIHVPAYYKDEYMMLCEKKNLIGDIEIQEEENNPYQERSVVKVKNHLYDVELVVECNNWLIQWLISEKNFSDFTSRLHLFSLKVKNDKIIACFDNNERNTIEYYLFSTSHKELVELLKSSNYEYCMAFVFGFYRVDDKYYAIQIRFLDHREGYKSLEDRRYKKFRG